MDPSLRNWLEILKNINLDEDQFKWTEAIINSMTKKEREIKTYKRLLKKKKLNIQESN